ncbi:MAG: hypothetical protein AAF660_11355, partial [Pseudomonadota bacterium]
MEESMMRNLRATQVTVWIATTLLLSSIHRTASADPVLLEDATETLKQCITTQLANSTVGDKPNVKSLLTAC